MNNISAKMELQSLPRHYTKKDAVKNDDIIYDSYQNYNAKRFFKFLENFTKGIHDRIRITIFGIDGPPSTSILEYNDSGLTFTFDPTRTIEQIPITEIKGTNISLNFIDAENAFLIQFNLQPFNDTGLYMFTYVVNN